MRRIIRIKNAKLVSAVCIFLLLSILFNPVALAYIDTPHGVAAVSSEDFTPKIEKNNYIEATNTLDDGGAKFYLITQDPSKAALTSVEYKGKTYALEAVIVATDGDIYKAKVPGDAFGIANHKTNNTNRTFFLDDGTYIDSSYVNYTNLSHTNFSLVGLNKKNNEPAAIIKKAAYPDDYSVAEIRGMIERYNLMHKNIYFENLIFDGDNRELLPLGDKKKGIGKNRGEYFFFITGVLENLSWKGTEGLVMRDIIIQNVGADNSTQPGGGWFTAYLRRKNCAIEFYKSRGQHNIEDVIIRNVKTKPGFGIIQSDGAKDNYLKNITILGDGANEKSRSIKVEDNFGGGDVITKEMINIFFGGELNLPSDPYHNHVYVQDYRYDHVTVPNDFKYAKWRTSNGGYYNESFLIYKDWPSYADLEPGAFFSSKYAVQDLKDNYWVVDCNHDKEDLNAQLKNIASVIKYTKAANVRRSPNANIKIARNTADAIPSFELPTDLRDGYVANIVAIDALTDQYTYNKMVAFIREGLIKGVIAKDKLHNFDFHIKANYTRMESVNGIIPIEANNLTDTVERDAALKAKFTNYPLYSTYAPTSNVEAKVQKSSMAHFINCRFTALVKELQASNPNPSINVGESVNLGVSVKVEEKADDKTLAYYSDNDSIVTVDNAGNIRGVSPGMATIYVKATDSYNDGEVEKPWLKITLSVNPTTTSTPVTSATPSPTPSLIPTPTQTLSPSPTPTMALNRLPQTGDGENAAAYIVLVLVSAVLIAVIMKKRKYN